ncbi:uncharacterized protein TRAVEDRAFT_49525 [Trametes versicolor FP-101664 SS1]|uniref:uncharacterized protein n=1 Tax=Trametes versicolor (strain FP-101664) TaxID=717944 RepID=UPI00046243C5|nr:uncharacterized protein TRAVEDRAFT_49525 [Trametes versicolor FP-101664 SS1]EIW56706.1 hypothetical protein TRAVEDRAFT_49525 [Trametes versicolor FP-101664 SS1]
MHEDASAILRPPCRFLVGRPFPTSHLFSRHLRLSGALQVSTERHIRRFSCAISSPAQKQPQHAGKCSYRRVSRTYPISRSPSTTRDDPSAPRQNPPRTHNTPSAANSPNSPTLSRLANSPHGLKSTTHSSHESGSTHPMRRNTHSRTRPRPAAASFDVGVLRDGRHRPPPFPGLFDGGEGASRTSLVTTRREYPDELDGFVRLGRTSRGGQEHGMDDTPSARSYAQAAPRYVRGATAPCEQPDRASTAKTRTRNAVRARDAARS